MSSPRRPLVLLPALAVLLLFLVCPPPLALAGGQEDYSEAFAAGRRGDQAEALRLYTKALDSGQLDAEAKVAAFCSRAFIYVDLRQYDNAIRDFDQTIRLRPDDSSFVWLRGTAYEASGQADKALADYDEAIRSGWPLAHMDRGTLLLEKGDYARAIQDFDQVTKRNLKDARPYSARAYAYKALKQMDKARAEARRARELDPTMHVPTFD